MNTNKETTNPLTGLKSFFIGTAPEDNTKVKRSSKRRSYGQIMEGILTLKGELIDLVHEKKGHVKRLDNDIERLNMERVDAKTEKDSAEGTIAFIDNMSKGTKPEEVSQDN